ncbi:MAG TPA: MEDS domain-containing protein, partial [Actinomycetes bacterium]|nr:MEDS domain-containing protein [Actinomycetes bacterium]
MTPPSAPWSAGGSVRELGLGDHLCHLFGADDELLSVVADAVSGGLAGHHQILIFAHRWGPEQLGYELKELVPGWPAAISGEQIEVHRSADSYLLDGRFDPEACVQALRRSVSRARANGYDGLRVVAEMGWAATPTTGTELVYSYEAWINPVIAAEPMAALCLYDRRLFDLSELAQASSVHPITTGQAALRCRCPDERSVV